MLDPRVVANDHHAHPPYRIHPSQLPRCPACGRLFYVNDGHRTYGSDACRQAAYRYRQLQKRNAAALARNVPRAALRALARNSSQGGG